MTWGYTKTFLSLMFVAAFLAFVGEVLLGLRHFPGGSVERLAMVPVLGLPVVALLDLFVWLRRRAG